MKRVQALVVEDNLCKRVLLAELLAVLGYEVHAVGVIHFRCGYAPKTDRLALLVTNAEGIVVARHMKNTMPRLKVIAMSSDDPVVDATLTPSFGINELWGSIVSAFP
jgi:CheY-like chemotaxis protein